MPAMIVELLPVGVFQSNCVILGCQETHEALVVDPGAEPDVILARLKHRNLHAKLVLHTHAHLDHVMATRQIKEAEGSMILLHPSDQELYESLPSQANYFGMKVPSPLPIDRFVTDGEAVIWGQLAGKILHTPGHTPGSLCFYLEPANLLLSGDTLFQRGIGRTDLWGGSYADLEASIRGKLYALPPQTRVICGHGPETTIADERNLNQFIRSQR
ncbi:MAG: MBL fold metallo-hydrolase [Cyanobacteria bacterium NC_groundwater_1444_Ag_S-0.65um_54_12]|nr:MBL fold metallo-hydrolase [Cyanobacteria bacterium NC_groundwater_1444_Ag_S-0.65um_54_12]